MFPVTLVIYLTAVLLFTICPIHGNLVFINQNVSLPVIQLLYKGSPLGVGVTAELVPESLNGSYAGKIVLAVEVVPMEDKWRDIQRRGAVAGITMASPGITPGRIEFWSDGKDSSDITMLTGELRFEDFRIANATLWRPENIDNTTNMPSALVTIDGWTENPWRILESLAFLVAWQIFLIAMHVAAFIYTITKFTLLVRYVGRIQISVAQMICFVEMIGLLIRIVYLAVDPLGPKKLVPYRGSQILITLSFPFCIASNLLVLFYWHELLSKRNMKVSPFLQRLVVPFIVFVAILLILDLAGGITRGYNLVQYFPIIVSVNAAFYAAALFASAVWIFVIAGRVLKRFKKSQKSLSKTDKLLLRTSVIITVSGCIYVVLTAIFILLFFPNIFWVPVSNLIIWFFLYALFTARGYLQVFMIKIPKNGKSSTSQVSGVEEQSTQTEQKTANNQLMKVSTEVPKEEAKESSDEESSKKKSSQKAPSSEQQKAESSPESPGQDNESSVESSSSVAEKSSNEESDE